MIRATPLLEPARAGSLAVIDYRCDAAAGEAAYPEVHEDYSVSFVRRGSFGYRCCGHGYELVAGSVLVGRPGAEYTCTHEHRDGGDECLCFRVAPALVDTLGARPEAWRVGALPPLPELMVMGELAQRAADAADDVSLDEAGLQFVHRYVELASGRADKPAALRGIDRRRAVEAALWIEAHAAEPLELADSAHAAGLSEFHFLRLFTRVLGVTPHQYLLRTRLRHAARLLGEPSRTITEIALEVGFNDLSNFVRTFRRAAGISPGGFRAAARGERKNFQDRLARAS
ncbi:MAG TPA: AraC family transcriptional regulator [Burkholderiaceae bacterium]